MRWHWFRKQERSLDWLEILTDASRPFGAAKLIWKQRNQRQFAVLGAVIVLLLLGINTFTQQVITEVNGQYQLAPDTAYVPINTQYTWYDEDTTLYVGTQEPIPGMIAAIQNGFYAFVPTTTLQSVNEYTYWGGDACDFGEYQSLAVCSQCEDIPQDVINPCRSGNCTVSDYYTLKHGVDLSLSTTNGIINITSDTKYPTGAALIPNVGPLIVRLNALVGKDAESPQNGQGAILTQCAAWWCVKTYSSIVVDNSFTETILDEYTNTSARTTYGQPDDINLIPPQCWINNTQQSTGSPNCTFTVGAKTQAALQNFLAGTTNNSIIFPPYLSGSTVYHGSGNNLTFNYTSQLAGALVSKSVEQPDVANEIKIGFTKMADQMTVSIRDATTQLYTEAYSYATSTSQAQRFHVRWAWIAFPIVIVFLALVFLIVTVYLTRNDEVWKDSILPIIFHGYGGLDHANLRTYDTVDAMRKESLKQRLFLGREHGHTFMQGGARGDAPSRLEQFEEGAAGIAGKMTQFFCGAADNIS